MHDTAFHLVDHVLPEAPYRQYVLSYPFPVRLALARNWAASASSRRMFLEEVFRFQRRKARQAGATKPKTGAISFTQRFGSKLNAHLHHHAALPDGAFASLDDGAVRFVRIFLGRMEPSDVLLVA
jgi:heme exporter protein D